MLHYAAFFFWHQKKQKRKKKEAEANFNFYRWGCLFVCLSVAPGRRRAIAGTDRKHVSPRIGEGGERELDMDPGQGQEDMWRKTVS